MSRRARLTALRELNEELAADPDSTVIAYIRPEDVDGWWADSMMSVIEYDNAHQQYLQAPGGRISYQTSPRLASPRNTVVRQFLAMPGKPQWLVFVDTDMVLPRNFLELLHQIADADERPVVGALCFAGGLETHIRPVLYRIFLDDDGDLMIANVEGYPEDTLVKLDATGAACFIVHRKVLEAIAAKWETVSAYPWFAETEHGLREFGEDVTFFMRVNIEGFPVHVHTGIQVGHRKKVTLNAALFDAQQADAGITRDEEGMWQRQSAG